MKREDSEVKACIAQTLKARWDASASMAVMEIKLGCGEFKVTSSEYGATAADEGMHDIVLSVVHGSPMQQRSTHIAKPALQWCSFWAWQDCMFPCGHACAVSRKSKEGDLNYVFTNLVDKNYTFANVKNAFKRNVFPGSILTRRIRNRSEFQASEHSPIICPNCGFRGHNRRNCNVPAQQRTDLLTNLSL